MNEFNIHQLKTNITLRYLLAISLIAILSTAAYYFLKSALSRSYDTALIVNISGRQRMLSQHIALDAHRLYMKRFDGTKFSSFSEQTLVNQLDKNATEMAIANEKLTTGRVKDVDVVPLSPKVKAMYFGQMNLNHRVMSYLHLAESLRMETNKEKARKILSQINHLSESLLHDLNAVVHEYQMEGEAKLSSVQQVELINWLLTLLVLVLEVLFIFRPMVHKIVQLTLSERQTMASLQELVELRTLHLEEANLRLVKLAQHDAMTGLLNRLNMEEDIEKAIEEYHQNKTPFALLMFDIDWFKRVNDTYGHDAGDEVLIEIANIIRHTVSHDDKVYRAGGEEFVVLLSYAPLDAAQHKAEEIRCAVELHDFQLDNQIHHLSVSGGLYHSDIESPTNVKDILKQVDIALYDSKKQGRNRLTHVSECKDFQTE